MVWWIIVYFSIVIACWKSLRNTAHQLQVLATLLNNSNQLILGISLRGISCTVVFTAIYLSILFNFFWIFHNLYIQRPAAYCWLILSFFKLFNFFTRIWTIILLFSKEKQVCSLWRFCDDLSTTWCFSDIRYRSCVEWSYDLRDNLQHRW